MNCFFTAPEFIEEDNRRFRKTSPVSKEQMTAKHSALLPASVVEGRSVLDLGCGLGATGHWCLSNGATHYTGIEMQSDYVRLARRLLGRYHPDKFVIHEIGMEAWLGKFDLYYYDIVCLLDVIHAFTDYYSILKASAAKAREIVAIEGAYPHGHEATPDFCGVQFRDDQEINLARKHESAVGRGTRLSPKGLQWVMREFGFQSRSGVILPAPVTQGPDQFNSPLGTPDMTIHYLMRFDRSSVSANSVSEDVQKGAQKTKAWTV